MGKAIAQQSSTPSKNDSITLAQAYINLTLTKEYFDGISVERISKILPFEEAELKSISDSTFIQTNAALYFFTHSLHNYIKTKFLFRTQKDRYRQTLVGWKESLTKSIDYFNLSKENSAWIQDNPFFELINYSEESYSQLHKELYDLKSLLTPYFNEDIYPDFKRILIKAKNSESFDIDSLSYFTGIYQLEYDTSILENTYEKENFDYGPNTLPLKSEYNHIERDYGYFPDSFPISNTYLLDPKLELINRYVQLKYLANDSTNSSRNPLHNYLIFNSYFTFKTDILNQNFFSKITEKENTFLRKEIDQKELDALFLDLRKNHSYPTYVVGQAYINLSLVQNNFEKLNYDFLTSTLNQQEIELREIEDSTFIKQNAEIYYFTYSLLFENTSRLLYESRRDILRKTLLDWKKTLEKSIIYFNLSQEEEISETDFNFYDLLKFTSEDIESLDSNINYLKNQYTPYFNEDIYPDFQKLFYQAKNQQVYDFESLKAIAGIFNIKLDFSVLENKEEIIQFGSSYEISQEYEILLKLDLISRFLQFKYLASDQFTNQSDEFSIEQLYNSYNDFINDLETEEDSFIQRELNEQVIDHLFQELQSKFPFEFEITTTKMESGKAASKDSDGDGIVDFLEREPPFFFPELAPLASARFTKANFKPELKTLGKVDDFLRREFISAGYENELHYYYTLDGFAITTSIEKFNLDGTAVPKEKRFINSFGENGKLSYYEIFKSIFFEIESEFRFFAFTVASRAQSMSKNGMTPSFAEELIENSYNKLPPDLKDKTLPQKALSIFVYHFHQNDIGGTVELDLSGKWSVQDHLKNAGISKIIQ